MAPEIFMPLLEFFFFKDLCTSAFVYLPFVCILAWIYIHPAHSVIDFVIHEEPEFSRRRDGHM